MNSSEAFERWAGKNGLDLDEQPNGAYTEPSTMDAFCGWQAAIKHCQSQSQKNEPQPDLLSTNGTLRDKFAMAAMQSLIAVDAYECSPQETASDAYKYADAMLEEREK